MIVIRVNVKIKPEETKNFKDFLQREMKDVRQFSGCEHFHLYEDI